MNSKQIVLNRSIQVTQGMLKIRFEALCTKSWVLLTSFLRWINDRNWPACSTYASYHFTFNHLSCEITIISFMDFSCEKCVIWQKFTLYLQFLYHTTANKIKWQNFPTKIAIAIKLTVNKDKDTKVHMQARDTMAVFGLTKNCLFIINTTQNLTLWRGQVLFVKGCLNLCIRRRSS